MDTVVLDRISFLIIQAAIEIHKALGPGLLESTYLTCLIYELKLRGLKVVSELVVPVRYKDLVLDGGYRIDLLVEDAVIVEVKAIETVLPVHRAQVLTYLRHTDKQLGLLINFNVDRLVLGVDRMVNRFGLPRSLQTRSRDIPTDTVVIAIVCLAAALAAIAASFVTAPV
jgi:GxxExxY protein